MCEEQVQATEVTNCSLLCASACLAALKPGIQIHTMTIKTIYDGDDAVSNALIDMYAKCGWIKDARMVLDSMSRRDVVSWNSMVSAYSTCSNIGSLDQWQSYFTFMREDYGIQLCMEHYTCVVSLLGRLGHLDKAVKMIEEIPHEPSVMVWRDLLGACVAHNSVKLGKFAAGDVLEMEPQDESSYVLLLSNIYANAKRWDNVTFVRKSMKKKRVKKEPGLVGLRTREWYTIFLLEMIHTQIEKLIRRTLEWLNFRSKKAGYAPNHGAISLDVGEDEKASLLGISLLEVLMMTR